MIVTEKMIIQQINEKTGMLEDVYIVVTDWVNVLKVNKEEYLVNKVGNKVILEPDITTIGYK